MKKEELEVLLELGLDVADAVIDMESKDAFQDFLFDNDIDFTNQESDDLLENIHSAVATEVARWSAEKLSELKKNTKK